MTKISQFNSVANHKFSIKTDYIWPLVVVVKTSSADEITRSGQLLYEYKGVEEITGQVVHPGSIVKLGSRCWQRPKIAFPTSRPRILTTFRDF